VTNLQRTVCTTLGLFAGVWAFTLGLPYVMLLVAVLLAALAVEMIVVGVRNWWTGPRLD
jgi:small neutral amino acid transporter SnatA (MarC family)